MKPIFVRKMLIFTQVQLSAPALYLSFYKLRTCIVITILVCSVHTSGLAMPHNLRKCSALRIRAVVNKFIQAHMDFQYSGDWTALTIVCTYSDGLTVGRWLSAVAAVTIESMGVTPPCAGGGSSFQVNLTLAVINEQLSAGLLVGALCKGGMERRDERWGGTWRQRVLC